MSAAWITSLAGPESVLAALGLRLLAGGEITT
jgi:hypothetical protein